MNGHLPNRMGDGFGANASATKAAVLYVAEDGFSWGYYASVDDALAFLDQSNMGARGLVYGGVWVKMEDGRWVAVRHSTTLG